MWRRSRWLYFPVFIALLFMACTGEFDSTPKATSGRDESASLSASTARPRATATPTAAATPTPAATATPTPMPTHTPTATAVAPQTPIPTPLPTSTPIQAPTATATAAPKPTPTATPVPPTPTPTPVDPLASLTLVLPFDIADIYDPVTETQGGISYLGDWVIKPYGGTVGGRYDDSWLVGDNGDIWFEVVPQTLLRASVSGRVTVRLNPVSGAPGRDWVVSIQIGNGPYSVGYDHMVDILVSDGDFVEAGQYLGRASPASFRHGGPEGEKPVDEFEWGMRRALPTKADSLCAYDFLSQADQVKLLSVLENMGNLGFHTGDKICLVHEMAG